MVKLKSSLGKEYLCLKWSRICSTIRPFPHSRLITGFVTRETWRCHTKCRNW